MKFSLKVGFCGLSLALVAGCSSTLENASTCAERDWYEVGRRDGAQGATLDRAQEYKKECGEGFAASIETIYLNGRNAGLVDYCATQNGFELGRSGQAYRYVCPSTVEPKFLASYREGQKAREVELQNQRLDAEIDQLLAQLNRTDNAFQKRQLASELDTKKRARRDNEKKLNQEN